MAYPITVQEINDRILLRADATSSAPGFTTDPERIYLINSLYRRLYNKLVDARGNEYYAVDGQLACQAGVNEYPLDSVSDQLWPPTITPGVASVQRPFLELVSLEIQNGNMVRPVKCWEHAELDYLRQMDASGARPWTMIKHRVMDTKLVLRVAPASSLYTMRYYYVPTAPVLGFASSEPSEETPAAPYVSNTIDGVNGFEDWIVLGGAIAIKEKKEHDLSGLMAERQMIDDEITRIKTARNAGHAPRVISRGNPWSLETVRFPFGLADPDDY